MSSRRYFLDSDGDGHWYLVDASRRADWSAWQNIPEGDERAWSVPAFAQALGGAPSWVEFSEPTMDGEAL